MNRPSYALAWLLAALGGPLFLAGTVRAEAPSPPVCTPPVVAVHPVDLFNSPLPCPGYINEYGDQDLAADSAANDAAALSVPRVATTPIGSQYDDLFDSLREAAGHAITAIQAKIVEADPAAYKADVPNQPAYEPYAEDNQVADEQTADEQVAEEAAAPASDASAVEGYESAFSGYEAASQDDVFEYSPVKNFDLDKVIAEQNRFSIDRFALRLWNSALESKWAQQANDYANEGYSLYLQLACEYPLERLVDASEDAWDRIEEHRRLSMPKPETIAVATQGLRLPYDDCGWDCDYAWQSGLSSVSPSPLAPRLNPTKREAILSLARSLRGLASQFEAASNLVAEWGGIDLAEIQPNKSAR